MCVCIYECVCLLDTACCLRCRFFHSLSLQDIVTAWGGDGGGLSAVGTAAGSGQHRAGRLQPRKAGAEGDEGDEDAARLLELEQKYALQSLKLGRQVPRDARTHTHLHTHTHTHTATRSLPDLSDRLYYRTCALSLTCFLVLKLLPRPLAYTVLHPYAAPRTPPCHTPVPGG